MHVNKSGMMWTHIFITYTYIIQANIHTYDINQIRETTISLGIQYFLWFYTNSPLCKMTVNFYQTSNEPEFDFREIFIPSLRIYSIKRPTPSTRLPPNILSLLHDPPQPTHFEHKKRNHIFLVIKDKTDSFSPLRFSCILNLNPRSLITKSFDVKLRDVLLRKMLFLFCLNKFLITSCREDSPSSFSFPCSTRQCTIHQSINKKPHDKTRQGTPLIEQCGLFLLFSCLNAKTHAECPWYLYHRVIKPSFSPVSSSFDFSSLSSFLSTIIPERFCQSPT